MRGHRNFKAVVIASAAVLALGLGAGAWGVVEAQKLTVPDLVGLSVDSLSRADSDGSLKLVPTSTLPATDLKEFATVTTQEPVAGTRVFAGTTVNYTYEMNTVTVPTLEGIAFEDAQNRLEDVGIRLTATRGIVPVRPPGGGGIGISLDAETGLLDTAAQALGVSVPITPGESFDLPATISAGSWRVTSIAPSTATTLEAGSTVEVTVELPLTQVPILTGMSYEDAADASKIAGLQPAKSAAASYMGAVPEKFEPRLEYLTYSYWGATEKDLLTEKLGNPQTWQVVTQSVGPGQIVKVNRPIELTPSWPTATVPNLDHVTAEAARQALHDAGLSWQDVSSMSTGVVQSQALAPGTVVPFGSRVDAQLGHEVTFTVTSSAPTGLVTWAAPGSLSIEQANGIELPWSKMFVREAAPGAYERGNLSAQMDASDGSITCEISIDGKVVLSKTSTGLYAVVMCG